MEQVVRSYIVRVYERKPGAANGITGVVEMIGSHGQHFFDSVEQLWDIIAAMQPARGRPADAR